MRARLGRYVPRRARVPEWSEIHRVTKSAGTPGEMGPTAVGRRKGRLALTGALAFAAAAMLLPPAAQATFPGEPGPIAFQRIVDPQDEGSSQIFSVARPGARARRLTSEGNGFNPDYSPDGEQIVFERRFGGVRPDALVTMGADGSSPRLVETACVADPCLGDNSPAWTPDGTRFIFERAFGPIVDDNASGLDLVTTSTDGSDERTLLRTRPLEAADGREVHDAQMSPDGTRIAVNLLNIRARPRNGSAIYVLDADGTDLRRVTPMRLNAGNPDWSPDGRRIVFNSSYEGQGAVELYTVRPDGSGLRRLRNEPRNSFAFEPVWSPNGRRIAFARATTTQVPHIWTMKRNGTGLRQITRGGKPDVRPDWGSR
jgi:TolB protein